MKWVRTKDSRIKKRGDFYWARFMKRGTPVEESLGTKSFQTAVRMVEEIESCILLGVDWRQEKEMFETAWSEFLSDKAKGLKTKVARPKTLIEYTNFGKRYFAPFFNEHRVSDLKDELWESYVEWVRSQNPTILFFNHRKYLMGFLSWAKRKGKIAEVPELRDPDLQNEDDSEDGPGKEYSLSELSLMREKSDGAFKLYILMGQYMAMRSSEITQLHKSRIDIRSRVIRLRRIDTKTAQSRVVPIHHAVMPHLTAQIMAHADSEYLFPNRADRARPMDRTGFKKRWDEIRSEIGFEGRFHDLKHTWITNALRCGMNPVVVSKVSGTSINVIMSTYLHLKDSDLKSDLAKLKLDDAKCIGQNPDTGGICEFSDEV